GISAPYTIHPGQRLRLYPQTGTAAARTTPAARTPARQTPPRSSSTAAVTPTQAPPQATPPAPAASPFSWRWPTDGQVVGRYVAGDPTKQGVGIAGNAGQAVRAAAAGVVVYSGAGLVGYGDLIFIKLDVPRLQADSHNRTHHDHGGPQYVTTHPMASLGCP